MRPKAWASPACARSTSAHTSAAASSGAGRLGHDRGRAAGWAGPVRRRRRRRVAHRRLTVGPVRPAVTGTGTGLLRRRGSVRAPPAGSARPDQRFGHRVQVDRGLLAGQRDRGPLRRGRRRCAWRPPSRQPVRHGAGRRAGAGRPARHLVAWGRRRAVQRRRTDIAGVTDDSSATGAADPLPGRRSASLTAAPSTTRGADDVRTDSDLRGTQPAQFPALRPPRREGFE